MADEVSPYWNGKFTGFTKVSTLLYASKATKTAQKDESFSNRRGESTENLVGRLHQETVTKICQNTDGVVQESTSKPQKRPKSIGASARRSTTAIQVGNAEELKSKKAGKKKPVQSAAQQKLAKGKVKKPCATSPEDHNVKNELCINHGETTAINETTENDTASLRRYGSTLGLERASVRRREWTPVRDSQDAGESLDLKLNDEIDNSETMDQSIASNSRLTNHLSSFEFDSSETPSLPVSIQASVEGLGVKRRRLDVSSP